ncbi:N-acetylglucosaminyl-phosphatidylinositol [Nesidiocoris tenuis]|uniref:N-acetylglucosaminylphosphatidylinositol deacetylase n=1 Tax=Nesidiocoris tenuis TaxID=355587 RepID=A0ABN7ASS6_9HEMI|nr:N-acetylglucosaminyl-phosphatidylinositol [Nesidiocoris tenuis]
MSYLNSSLASGESFHSLVVDPDDAHSSSVLYGVSELISISWSHIFFAWILFFFLSVLSISLSHIYSNVTNTWTQESVIRGKRVLLVTAHPDDECMFFGPTILNLTRRNADVHLICLSDGNYYGDGETRSAELWNSCKELGIDEGNIRLLSYEQFPDNPNVDWDTETLASLVSWYVGALLIDALLTFDGYGVSGHRNHIAISRAVNRLLAENRLPPNCKCYALKSENIFIKYLGFLVVLLRRSSPNVYICSSTDHKTIQTAMSMHASQNVWFRKLFMKFSSYSYLNTLFCLNS